MLLAEMGSKGKKEAVVMPAAADADYAQFAERNLDKLSWLYPLVNNKVGQLLHLQLRHAHLFFMKDGEVVDEIGYGDDSVRFHEREWGKPMLTLQDITSRGYWFNGRRHNARAAYEALGQVEDGAYYSLFSNQCQDWANRVRQKTEQIEAAERLQPPQGEEAYAPLYREVAPTTPAAWYFGLVAILAGVIGLGSPLMAGAHYVRLVALLIFAIGASDLVYAFYSKAWGTFISTALFGLFSMAGGAAIWASDFFLSSHGNGLLALFLVGAGLARIGVAVRSRPFSAWAGTLLSGLLLVITGWIAWHFRDGGTATWLLGASLSLSFISAGVSTIWLNWELRRKATATAKAPSQ